MNWLDRLTLTFAPEWTLRRLRARAASSAVTTSRIYEAASTSRRTSGWNRSKLDADGLLRVAVAELRTHARDLLRNNGFAIRGQSSITNAVVGWGIVPRPNSADADLNARARAAWLPWAESTDCDVEGRSNFAGIQAQCVDALVSDGEVLVRRRVRRPSDGLALPLQLQVLEADYLDLEKTGPGTEGGYITMGVERDAIGRRTAYWLFEDHPGNGTRSTGVSRRVDARDVAHLMLPRRPGQTRGVSWLGAAIVPLKELDEFEDAELMRQKIAACFAAFVTDPNGAASPLGELTQDADGSESIETFEPGMIHHLPPGKDVVVASPPATVNDSFTARNYRRVAAALGVTYEDLTGDYSHVNFSSARMGRIAFQGNVRRWQATLVVPQLCAAVWGWAMKAAELADRLGSAVPAEWTAPPLPMIEPDREGLAYQRLVRTGAMTPSEMVREQGGDPESHWAAYAEDLKRFDALGLKLDCDVRAVSQAGLTQERVGGGGGGGQPPADKPSA